MPSPFPGMDPFIEAQVWDDFHSVFNPLLQEMLNPHVRPRYVTRVQHRVVLEREDGEPQERYPDVGVFATGDWTPGSDTTGGLAVAEPQTVTMPSPDEYRLHFVEIREAKSGRLVTVIETLSPSNKRPSGADRDSYLAKRQEVLRSHASFVEIDLLRRGRPFPPADARPPETFAALVIRPWDWPHADLYPVPLLSPLPTIPIPLDEGEDPVALDLQAAVATVYGRAAYETMDYAALLDPPLPAAALSCVE